jgi:hypothetical protein
MDATQITPKDMLDRVTIKSYGLGAEITKSRYSDRSASWIITLDNGQTFELKITEK